MNGDSPIIEVATALALPAAGAFTGLTAFSVANATECSLWLTYTQGAAGGAPVVRVRWFPIGAGTVPTVPGNHTGVVITGGTMLGAEEWTLANPGSSPYARVLHIKVPPSTSTAEFQVAEIGVVGTPGTVTAWAGVRGGI